MSWTAEKVEVACPRCGEWFEDWVRPSHDPATSSSCPVCGHRLERDPSIRQDGALHAAAADVDEPDR
jgi:predicted RNA-binding Zn-ribbon protein involved in translation (DUF1610 family)